MEESSIKIRKIPTTHQTVTAIKKEEFPLQGECLTSTIGYRAEDRVGLA